MAKLHNVSITIMFIGIPFRYQITQQLALKSHAKQMELLPQFPTGLIVEHLSRALLTQYRTKQLHF
jgi:hypothetical protein